MKIRKISINNFKNVKNEVVVDFRKDVSLLVGPNGFGKTTIFDAIELALTGTIYRISNSVITDGRSTFTNAYFQNDINRDVVIKLLVCNPDGEQITIVRWYRNNHLPGKDRKMNPTNSLSQFQLLVGDKDSFDSTSLLSDMKVSNQEAINDFIGFHNSNYKIQDIYNLFNYIQQEDTDYYLRKSERTRKDTLGFLLQIQDYQNKKLKIGTLESNFNKLRQTLFDQEKMFRQNNIMDAINFEPLPFAPNKNNKLNQEEIEFDQDLSEEVLHRYMKELDELIDFREKFSPDEYSRKIQKKKFKTEILNNEELQNYIIFRKLVMNNHSANLITHNHLLLNERNNYRYYLLEKFIDNVDFLEKQIITKNNISQFKSYINSKIETINLERLVEIFERDNSFISLKDIFALFQSNLEIFSEKNKKLLNIQNDYSEINALRNKLNHHFLPTDKEHSQCVLCGYDWEIKNILKEQFEATSRILDDNMSIIQKEVSDLRLNLDDNIKKCMMKYL